MVRLLYVSLARPHLEYAVPVWNPYLKKDIEKLEVIQHKMTRLMPTLRKKEYGFRLSKLRLKTLETRRKRGNLIEFYKIINGSDQVKWKNMQERIAQGDKNGPVVRNLRKGGICFRREPATLNSLNSLNSFFYSKKISYFIIKLIEFEEEFFKFVLLFCII